MALEKQMELFEEGGLMQEGGTVDEESGNEVPTGSLKKEVRDDIPAQLSEGEFVMPADVVRYHGLDKMMALRDEAKSGLQRMDDMGQMGNSEEAVIPDGVPFSMDDLDIEDEPVEMQVGGFVQPPVVNAPTVPSQFANRQTQYTPYEVPTYGTYQPPQPQAVPTAPTGLPSFSDFVTPKYELYVNDAGNTISIPVDANGNPLIPVPAGYRKMSEQAGVTPTTPDTGITPVAATVSQPSGSDNAPPTPAGPRLDQFGREEDPRITQVTQSEQFAKLSKDVDPRGFLEKIKDDFLGAIGASTTSQEYQKALNELSVGVANYTSDPEEQSRLIAEIRGNMGQPTRTELGTGLAPIVTDEEVAAQKLADQYSGMTEAGDFDYGDAGVGVETARITEEAGTTAAQAAERRLEATKTDIEKRMDDIGLQGNQRKDFLNAIINQEKTSIDFKSGRAFPESYTGIMPDTTVDFAPATSIAQAQAQTSAAQRLLDEQVARERRTTTDILGSLRREPETVTARPTQFAPIDTEGVVEEETRIQQTRVARNQRIQEEAEEQTQNYRNRGYSETAAKQAGQNKARADDEAREQTGEPQAKAVTDKYGNPVRSGDGSGSVVTSNREQKDDSPEPDSRWCCSQMVHRGLWTQQHEFARLTVWSSKQPDWWKSGYHVWGKVLAKTFLRKKGFWTDVMQSFYDYHIRKKPYTWRTALAHVMVYPGVFICGNIWTKQPKGVTLASFKELNG